MIKIDEALEFAESCDADLRYMKEHLGVSVPDQQVTDSPRVTGCNHDHRQRKS
jgi:hypothetical protein